jgi:hypothetical protein
MAKSPMIVKITWADNAQPAFKSGLEIIPIHGETLRKISEEPKVTTYRWMTDQAVGVANGAIQQFVQTQDMINALTGKQILGVSVEAEAPAAPAPVAPTITPAPVAAAPWYMNKMVWAGCGAVALLALLLGTKHGSGEA